MTEIVAKLSVNTVFHCPHCTNMFIAPTIMLLVFESAPIKGSRFRIVSAESVKECENCRQFAPIYRERTIV